LGWGHRRYQQAFIQFNACEFGEEFSEEFGKEFGSSGQHLSTKSYGTLSNRRYS
jgi:hypothetical protein